MPPSTSTLDHLVYLTPPATLDESITKFQNLGFNVIRGGTHADGLTSNALVIFEDGTYLELLNFVKPASAYPPGSPERTKRDAHPWASKEPGWTDYAFLGTGDNQNELNMISQIINARSKADGSGVEYLAEVAGGRETPQGKVLKWLITSPAVDKHGRGVLPFFCGDVTPREWRVPLSEVHHNHPSGTKGIAHIVLQAASNDLDDLARHLSTVVGAPPSKVDDELSWSIETINTTLPTKLRVRSDDVHSGSAKIHEVGFWVDRDDGGSATTPYGRIVWQPIKDK